MKYFLLAALIFLFPFKVLAFELSASQVASGKKYLIFDGSPLTSVGCMSGASYNYYFFSRPPFNSSQVFSYKVITFVKGGAGVSGIATVATPDGSRGASPFSYGWPVTNALFLPYLQADRNYLPSDKCSFEQEECIVNNLTNANDMLCEENYGGGNLILNGKRREY